MDDLSAILATKHGRRVHGPVGADFENVQSGKEVRLAEQGWQESWRAEGVVPAPLVRWAIVLFAHGWVACETACSTVVMICGGRR